MREVTDTPMTEDQRFLFDLQGYLVVPGVLDLARVQRMLGEMDAHSVNPPEGGSDNYRFAAFLRWSDDYRHLIDEPALLPILTSLLGPKFRLDHAYGMASRANTSGHPAKEESVSLHHHADMFDYGCYYLARGDRMHNGLIVVSYSLTDIGPGAGGFCCIPGSHKSNVRMPEHFYRIADNPLVRQVPQRAGDAVIFTESLTHGTWPWTDPTAQRRSVLMKYCPGYMQWLNGAMDSNIEELTERQRLILQGASVNQRPAVEMAASDAAS